MKKQISTHASVIIYFGAHYEYVLSTYLGAKGESLDPKMKSVRKKITEHGDDLWNNLRRFLCVRNDCAHQKDYGRLASVQEAIILIKLIEDGFAEIIPAYKPDYATDSDFEQDTPPQKIITIEVPGPEIKVEVPGPIQRVKEVPVTILIGLGFILTSFFVAVTGDGFTRSYIKETHWFRPDEIGHEDTNAVNLLTIGVVIIILYVVKKIYDFITK